MTQEDKNLLLKDLSARLLYGVKFNHGGYDGCDYKVELITSTIVNDFPIEDCKPYLRPMSSMTEDEKNEHFGRTMTIDIVQTSKEVIDWLNKHHFDYRGLIEKGLALEAPEGMYN